MRRLLFCGGNLKYQSQLQSVLNTILEVFVRHGVVELSAAGNRVVVTVDGVQMILPNSWLNTSIRERIDDRWYSQPQITEPLEIPNILRSMLSRYMYPELLNIDAEIDALEMKIKQSTRKGHQHKKRKTIRPPQGRVHYQFTQGSKRYVLSSDAPANSSTLHELPMYYQLQSHWPYGKILKSFSMFQETPTTWRRVFELDAISIHAGDLFIFEMKNTTYDPTRLLIQFQNAARYINRWTSDMGTPIEKIVPIVYLRHECGVIDSTLNRLYYEEVCNGVSEKIICSLKAYPL